MKLLKYLLASIALIAGTAQANTISTTVRIDNAPINQTVAYVNFKVTDAGLFNISAVESFLSLTDPYIYLFASPASVGTFIESSDDVSFLNNNSLISRNLNIGSYVLAVSTYDFSLSEAISGYNGSVNFINDGDVKITISSHNGVAEFTNPSAVPVPAAAWLFGSALMGFAGFRRKSV
ncbi:MULTISPECIES: DVUA0089 family protein [Methylotenera]|uniref:DVUA0089 family protein n=1 Tax=Methylotenera TaxID=359407 RepID=UPI00036F3AFC|nr:MULTISPECIES: DVUA0089 family protein [Methylotenera]